MASITVASVALPNWQRDNDVQLRVFALQSFTAADGSLIVGGPVNKEDETSNNNWYALGACTLSGTTLTIPSMTIESTTDSSDPGALLCACFFTSEGQYICDFGEFSSFALPASPTSTTWAAIAAAQNS